jgi:hypothetical protein
MSWRGRSRLHSKYNISFNLHHVVTQVAMQYVAYTVVWTLLKGWNKFSDLLSTLVGVIRSMYVTLCSLSLVTSWQTWQQNLLEEVFVIMKDELGDTDTLNSSSPEK